MDNPEFQKPIFGFLWPGNVNTTGHQLRFMRVVPRGFIRLTILIIFTLTLMSGTTISITYLLLAQNIPESLLAGAVIATIAVITFRAWMVGTFINDNGIKIVNLFSTRGAHWDQVAFVERDYFTWHLGKLPIGKSTLRITIVTKESQRLPTHVYVGSIDGIYSESKFEITYSLINRWFRSE